MSDDEFVLQGTGVKTEVVKPKPRKGQREMIREEIDGYYRVMKTFADPATDPQDVYLYLSGWTSRMSELKGQLHRTDSAIASQLRIREIEPFIDECERQFRYHSRRMSAWEAEAKLQR